MQGHQMSLVVLFPYGDARISLLLAEVKRFHDGVVASGEVINGAWRMGIVDGNLCAYDHSYKKPVSVTPVDLSKMVDVVVPDEMRNKDYGDIIDWAETQAFGEKT